MSAYITYHAEMRMCQRGICADTLELILQFGRKIRSKGAIFYVIGKKEIQRYCQVEPKLRNMEGMQVLTTHEGTVITTYRNKNLRSIRPCARKHSHLH